jgi:hypothetical protein
MLGIIALVLWRILSDSNCNREMAGITAKCTQRDAYERNLLAPEKPMMLLIPAAQHQTPFRRFFTFLACRFGIPDSLLHRDGLLQTLYITKWKRLVKTLGL